MKKIAKVLLSRIVIVGVLILLQAAFLVVAIWRLSEEFVYLQPILIVLSGLCAVWVISKDDNPAYKIPWILIVMALPIFGGLFYVFFGNNKVPGPCAAGSARSTTRPRTS